MKSYVGVSRHRAQGRYTAVLDGITLGSWSTARAAAVARDRAIKFLESDLELQVPKESKRKGPASPEDLRREAQLLYRKNSRYPRRYIGLSYVAARDSWAASCTHNGERIQIGNYPTAKDAAEARDRLAKYMLGEEAILNFPDSSLPPASPRQLSRELITNNKLRKHRQKARARKSRPPGEYHGYIGVLYIAPTNRWQASVTHQGVSYQVNSYDTETEAAEARDRLAKHLKGAEAVLNFPNRRLKAASLDELRKERRQARERRRRLPS
jgi:hypothetical protein